MKTQTQTVIAAAIVGASVVNAGKSFFKTKRQNIQLRKEIKANTQANLRAIWIAHAIVEERIRQGVYNGANVTALFDDIEFEEIKAFNEQ
jgi:hypothetical protein